MFAMLSSLILSTVLAATPQQTYFAKDVPVIVTIEEADGLLWMDPDGRVMSRTDLDPGEVRLDTLLPGLRNSRRLSYVQPLVAGEPTGSALVIEPLLSPRRARFDEAEVTVRVERGSPTVNGIRVYPESLVRINTDQGEMTFRLRPDQAPNTVWNFRNLVQGGFYNGTSFHRIVADYIIQGGDPLANGRGGPGYWIDFEESHLPHDFGILSMARRFDDPDSAGSQFFICLSRERTESLDGLFVAFGEMYDGADTIRALGAVETDPVAERPLRLPVIRSADLIPAPPRHEIPLEELLKDAPPELLEIVREKLER